MLVSFMKRAIRTATPIAIMASCLGFPAEASAALAVRQEPSVVFAVRSVSCSPAALAAAISAPYGKVLLAPGCRYSLKTPLPRISRNLTIVGNNDILLRSYAQGTPLFSLLSTAPNVQLIVENLTLLNGDSAANGGAINNSGAGRLTIHNVVFRDNTASLGGAIYTAAGGTTLLYNSTFTSNKAGSGGAIYSTSHMTAVNDTFQGNAAQQGGAVYLAEDGIAGLQGSTFAGNRADSGGAIDSSSAAHVLAANVTFRGNAAQQGGAFYMAQDGVARLQGITFARNRAGSGGAISSAGKLYLTSCAFIADTADDKGGAILSQSRLTASFLTLRHNRASQGGGIYATDGLTVDKSAVLGNNATGVLEEADGGAIDNSGVGYMGISNTTFKSNTAAQGGALYNHPHGTARVWLSTFTSNTADSGGAIDNESGLKLFSDTFITNTVADSGGAILSRHTLLGEFLTFRRNQASQGGGIYATHNLVVDSSVLLSNTAIGTHEQPDGGGIYNLGSAYLTGVYLRNNEAGFDGGAIYTGTSFLYIVRSSIFGNYAGIGLTGGDGGGIYDGSDDQVKISLQQSDVTLNYPLNCAPSGSFSGCDG
jgi:predicted outer membrane repeat protein